ncbi:hypothetical protein DPMN_024706 [Dreissena polymorpha]|uniref:Uncharacterized protein n=1 Tax=Dreissena polymorpha TaxID=45954 RepID=A0A9D4LPN0_DREPO|nr:hypothetical protein DPMN_024706 [Dreissena polymorpha]
MRRAYVAGLVHAYTATRQKSTGFCPHILMFGRHPRLAIDAFLALPTDSLQSEYKRKLQDGLRFVYDKAQ